ncbi:MAG: thioredoxin domain-containing protein [Bacteroidales bacterium]|nr:thioredoxin domain-containing protein [Bacteroidales bacterium]
MTLRRFKTAVLPLLAACLALAGWMVFHSLTGVRMAGCGVGSACDSVMGSPWAYVLGGVPVSLPASVAYLLLGICVLFLGGDKPEDRSLDRLLWPLMLLLSGCIIGAALWFCCLQAFVLHAFCKYCTLLHLLGIAAAVLVIVAAKRAGERIAPPLAVGLIAAALFAVLQAYTRPDARYDAGKTDAYLPSFTDGEIPVLGAQDASDELTLLFDFQCIHCRRLHKVLPELLEKAPEYRIRLCPVPLSSDCNPYLPNTGIDRFAGSCPLTRYALAVWYARPEAFAPYWDYLLGDGDAKAAVTPAYAEARARALLGDAFDAAVADPRIDTYLRKVEELFGRTSNAQTSGVPRLVHGQNWLVPETEKADELVELIRLSL